MSKEASVIFLHGMGDGRDDLSTPQNPTYHLDLVSILEEQFSESQFNELHFEPIFYHDVIQHRQEDIFEAMTAKGLDWTWARRFAFYFLSDAVVFERAKEDPNSPYQRTQQKIKDAFDHISGSVGVDKPVFILAHSLGCQVISNYFYDVQNRKGIWRNIEPTDLQKGSHLKSLLTVGCNIPLFVSGFNSIKPIDPPSVPASEFQWVNFYDNDDVLGWPLSPLGGGYESLVEDRKIQIGETPFTHNGYFKSRVVATTLADRIKSTLGYE